MGHVVGIIPARGGSKGIPRKNLIPLCGLPLINYTLRAALTSQCIDKIVVSTDSEEIASHCTANGCKVDSLRPENLSTDEARTSDVVIYEIEKYERENGVRIDDIILLQPTAPLRTATDIDEAHRIFQASSRPSLISCYDAESVHPTIMYRKENNVLIPYTGSTTVKRRQDFEKVYIRNGALYITKRDYILSTNTLVSEEPAFYLMPKERSINIDSQDDLLLAEYRLKKG